MNERHGKRNWPVKGVCALLGAVMLAIPAVSAQAAVAWRNCSEAAFSDWFKGTQLPAGMLCGRVTVPLAYDGSLAQKTVQLAVTRLPATGRKEGSLVLISGGPGLAGIDLVNSLSAEALTALRSRYDLIGYDPRGVGQSTPAVRCEGKEQAAWIADRNLAAATIRQAEGEAEAEARESALGCVEFSGLDLLKHIGTREAVEDVERLREELGEPQLNALAYSYGTKVAAIYAERYPGKVRAMVLDGVVDLSETPSMQLIAQARAYQQEFEAFVASCARSKSCPLPAKPERAAQAIQAMLARLREAPLQGRTGKPFTADDLQSAIAMGILWPEQWPTLAKGLGEVSRGQSRTLQGLLSDFGDFQGAALAIGCADDASGDVKRAVLKRQGDRLNKASPLWMRADSSLAACDFWPFPGSSPAHVPELSPDLPPLLFVAQRRDATTPHLNAQRMAAYLDSPLLTREGDGHTLALTGLDACVDAAVLDYLATSGRERDDQVCTPKRR
jgi:pimeloyl-ACP methyl ester carboxylesterase